MAKKKKKKEEFKVQCPNCAEYQEPKHIYSCPECGRDGCSKCVMRAGIGCICTQCEGEKE